MNFYPRFPGDYMRKTMHLSMLEDGAYTRLLDWYYANDSAIPNDRRYAVARASTAAERNAVDAVLGMFFTLIEGQQHNQRADNEIEAGRKRIDAAKENGKKGGRKPGRQPEKNPMGSDQLPPAPKPIESSPSPNTDSLPKGSSSGAAKAPRSSRKCPESFQPEDPDAFVASEALDIDWQAETKKFRDHTFDKAKTDWQGTWRNWMRRANETRPRSSVTSLSFRERDAQTAAARVREMTGGLVDAKPSGLRADPFTEVFDATPRLVG